MKKVKRNIIVFAVLVFVCAAVYLNWSYNNNEEQMAALNDTNADGNETLQDTANIGAEDMTVSADNDENSDLDSAGLYYTEGNENITVSEYFANVRLNRTQARDSAVETLAAVSETEGASQETIDTALAEITQVAEYTVLEAELEGLILAKGFEECVVFINDGGIDVTVPASGEGLSTAAVARITDIVLTETDFGADDLTIIEVRE